MSEADPYRVLGVAANASQPEIRARFLALSLEVHCPYSIAMIILLDTRIC